jgi:hypothetical protein
MMKEKSPCSQSPLAGSSHIPQPNMARPSTVIVSLGVSTVLEVLEPNMVIESGRVFENMKNSGGTIPNKKRKPAVSHQAMRLPLSASPIMKANAAQPRAEPNKNKDMRIVHQGKEPLILVGISLIAATTFSLEI